MVKKLRSFMLPPAGQDQTGDRPSNLRPRKNAHTDFEQFYSFSTLFGREVGGVHQLVPVVSQDFQTFDGVVARIAFVLDVGVRSINHIFNPLPG